MRRATLIVTVLMGMVLSQVQIRGCSAPPPAPAPPPNTLELGTQQQVVNLSAPFDVTVSFYEVGMYGEAIQESPNATGIYSTASGTTTRLGPLATIANVFFDDRRLPATWRFRVNTSSAYCYNGWGPEKAVPLAGNYLYVCKIFQQNNVVVGTDPDAISLTHDGISVPDAVDRGAQLPSDEMLHDGEALISPSGEWTLMFMYGELVLFDGDYEPQWDTNSAGFAGGVAYMQSDGNLVIYDPNWDPVWDTVTDGNSGAWLNMQDDGNIVVYRPGPVPIWSLW